MRRIEAVPDKSDWHRVADIFGWLALICWLPYLVFFADGMRFLPDSMFVVAIVYLFWGPYVAASLALVAATARRWQWMLLAAASLAASSYHFWYLSRHPFDL